MRSRLSAGFYPIILCYRLRICDSTGRHGWFTPTLRGRRGEASHGLKYVDRAAPSIGQAHTQITVRDCQARYWRRRRRRWWSCCWRRTNLHQKLNGLPESWITFEFTIGFCSGRLCDSGEVFGAQTTTQPHDGQIALGDEMALSRGRWVPEFDLWNNEGKIRKTTSCDEQIPKNNSTRSIMN